MIKTSSPFVVPKAPEILYRNELYTLIKAMAKDYRTLLEVYKDKREQIAMDDTKGTWLTTAISEKLKKLGIKWAKRFEEYAEEHSKKFVNKIAKMSNTQIKFLLKNWFSAERLTLFGQTIPTELKQVMNANIEYNVSLIKSIPAHYHDRVLGSVMRSITNNGSLKQLTIELARYKDMEYRKAKLIASDQTRKIYSNITLHNCQRLGIKKMKWIHSGGGKKPRDYHQRRWDGKSGLLDGHPNGLNGFIFDIDKKPVIQERYTMKSGKVVEEVRGYPAELPNCRCVMVAVFE